MPVHRIKQMAIEAPFFHELVEAIGEAPSEGKSSDAKLSVATQLIDTLVLVVCAFG
ncbi:hypothetical protein OH492_17450 [Vibrio chagasii]|nr:hypothetical protein [Vibrio chagasii]